MEWIPESLKQLKEILAILKDKPEVFISIIVGLLVSVIVIYICKRKFDADEKNDVYNKITEAAKIGEAYKGEINEIVSAFKKYLDDFKKDILQKI